MRDVKIFIILVQAYRSVRLWTSANSAGADACCDRGDTHCLKWFLNDGAPYPEIVGNRPFCFAWFSLCTLAIGCFYPVAVLCSVPNQFLREVLSSQIKEPQKKTMVGALLS